MNINEQEELRKYSFCEENLKSSLNLEDAKFINSVSIIKYLNFKAKQNNTSLHQELMVLYNEIYNNPKYISTMAINILHHLERAGFIGVKKIEKYSAITKKAFHSYYLADILKFSAKDMLSVSGIGKVRLSYLKNYLDELEIELFTSNELKQLESCGFNFYGEGASAKELIDLGLDEDLVYKLIRNRMLVKGVDSELYKTLNNGRLVKIEIEATNEVESSNLSTNQDEMKNTKKISAKQSPIEEKIGDSLIEKLILKSNLIKNISKEEFEKHTPEFYQKYTDRIIAKGLAKEKERELTICPLEDKDLLEYLKGNPNNLHKLTEDFVVAYEDSIKDIIANSTRLSPNRKIYMQKQLYKIVKNYLKINKINKV